MKEFVEKLISRFEEQKVTYRNIRKNTYCRKTEMDDCDSCRADHYLDARLEGINKAKAIVNELAEEYKGGWIPCSERLPNKEECLKNDGRFIVTDGNRTYQSIYDIYESRFKTLVIRVSGWSYEEDKCAIAWHPLPQPYKKGSGENEQIN